MRPLVFTSGITLSSRKVEDLQFRVEEESITKGDLEVLIIGINH